MDPGAILILHLNFSEDLAADDEPPPAPTEVQTQQSTIDSLDEKLNEYDEEGGENKEDEETPEDGIENLDDEPSPENAEDMEDDGDNEEKDEEKEDEEMEETE